jgi:hypothetical protein
MSDTINNPTDFSGEWLETRLEPKIFLIRLASPFEIAVFLAYAAFFSTDTPHISFASLLIIGRISGQYLLAYSSESS